MELKLIFQTVVNKLDSIENKLLQNTQNPKGFYRNKDLKKLFGLSGNTIIKYRENGTLPSTIIGDVYLYPKDLIDEVLSKNSSYLAK